MPPKQLAFTTTNTEKVNTLMSDVFFVQHDPGNPTINSGRIRQPDPKYLLHAIWDTGATSSCIKQSKADELGLISHGKGKIITPSGESDECNRYFVDIFLPNKVAIQRVQIIGAPGLGDVDALIGMDIILMGDFAVSCHQGKTAFSFRFPSMGLLDFVNHSYLVPHVAKAEPGRNEQCPCGSGKKYKNCHGSNS